METIRRAAIGGFNDFLQDQQSAPGQARLALAPADDELEFPCEGIPVAGVIPLNHDTFVPRSSTALLDAIAATVDWLANWIRSSPADQQPDHVVVTILTDGAENSSHRFTWHDIPARIANQKSNHGWASYTSEPVRTRSSRQQSRISAGPKPLSARR